jgi:hypothetical protein
MVWLRPLVLKKKKKNLKPWRLIRSPTAPPDLGRAGRGRKEVL